MKTLAKVGATSNSLWWAINGVGLLQPIAFGVTIGRSPVSFSNLELYQNIQFLTFSILIVDLNSQRYEVHLQGT